MNNTEYNSSFTAVTRYYDELMGSVPYRFWSRYILQLCSRHNHVPHRLLDLCCGTGTMSLIFHEMGLEVVGVDLSEGMIAQARQKAEAKDIPVPFYVQDAAELDVPGSFDTCICLYDSLNYILDETRLQMAFQQVYDHLLPGSLFIFDLNTEYAFAESLFNQNCEDEKATLNYNWIGTYNAETHICEVNMTFLVRNDKGEVTEEFNEQHHERAYDLADIKSWLMQVGFDSVRSFNSYSQHAPDKRSDRVHFVARKWKA